MASIEHPVCGVRGRLADAEVIKLQNLAHTGSVYNWDNAELACQLPEGHADDEDDQHIQWVTDQDLGQELQPWWASWLDIDGLRDEAVMFTGPRCNATLDESRGGPFGQYVWECALLAGHAQSDGGLHMTTEGAEFGSSKRIAWRAVRQAGPNGDRRVMH